MILDDFQISHWLTINSSILQELQNYNNAEIYVQVFKFPNKEKLAFYNQFGLENFLLVSPRIAHLGRILKKALDVSVTAKIGSDVMDFEIDECRIGVDIYESILRRGYPTWDTKRMAQHRTILTGVSQYYFVDEIFKNNTVKTIAVSHDNYIGPGLLARVAYKNQVPVILANPLEVTITTKSFQNYEKFEKYKLYSNSLSSLEYDSGVRRAEVELQSRLNGNLDPNMTYQLKSAFSSVVTRQLSTKNCLKIVVATQDFFDSPHGYGEMSYYDFMDWMNSIAEFSKKTDTEMEWYLKCHADASSAQYKIVEDFSFNNPSFKVINPETPWHQLREEGLSIVLTCYGSVAHELPLLRIPVLCFSYNPHVAYEFSTLVKRGENLIDMIQRKHFSLQDNDLFESCKSAIYDFYYVHNYVCLNDELFLNSYRSFSRTYGENWNSQSAQIELFKQNMKIKESAKRIVEELKVNNYVRYFETQLDEFVYEKLKSEVVERMFNQ